MIKKRRLVWLPTTLEALAPWFSNFALKFAEFAAELGFTPADVTSVNNDALVVNWLLDAEQAFEANIVGFRKFRDETLFAEKGDAAPPFPLTVLPPQPATLTTAIIERLVNLVERIQLSDKYTGEIGAQLGILTTTPEQIAPENWKPEIKANAAPGGKIENSFVRGESDGILYEMQVGAETVWTEKARFFKSPGTITVNGDQPQTVRLRARYLLDDEPVGQYSDIIQIVSTP